MTVDGTNKASLESSKEVSVAPLPDIEVKIFRSSKKADTYIYLPIEVGVLPSQDYRTRRRANRIRHQASVEANPFRTNPINVRRRHHSG